MEYMTRVYNDNNRENSSLNAFFVYFLDLQGPWQIAFKS